MRQLTQPVRDEEKLATPTSLYVHIPFCRSRCFYCDFNTYVAPDSVMVDYVDALGAEFEKLSQSAPGPLQTVFFGGGTPTLPSSLLLERMLKQLHAHFSLAAGAEFTFESNPDSVDEEKLALLRSFGVNRLSFGAQTFRDRLLMTIGRAHDAQKVVDSVERAYQLGFRQINVDLMFGLPEQSLADVEHALDKVLSLPIDHVSAYWLKVEEGTPFAKWRDSGQLPLPGEDLEADMYDLVRDRLQQAGFVHYEISNFARPGGEARHNLVYWRNQPYLAAGAGAHGYVKGVRYENMPKLPDYIGTLKAGNRPILSSYDVTDAEAAEDTMMLGLRLAEGVSKEDFVLRYGVTIEDVYGDVYTQLLEQGLLVETASRVRIPARYWPVANAIFEKFVSVGGAD